MPIIKTLLLLLLPTALCAQLNNSLVKHWKSYPIPQSNQMHLLYTKDFQSVFLKDGEITTANVYLNIVENELPFEFKPIGYIEEMTMKGSKSVFKIDNGYLIGFDNGEFGGSLYWFSNNGKQKYKISEHNIQQFIMRDGMLFAIEGLCHMGTDTGGILLISNVEGKWVAKDYLKLPYAPMAIQLDRNKNLIIATSSALLSIDNQANITVLDDYGKWQPNKHLLSLLIQNDVAYVGMRGGIYRFNLKTKTAEWLLPD